jgi:hypothetical protein
MKTEILLQRNPNRKFADVARSIAKGDPPKWLILGLTSGFRFGGTFLTASNTLKTWLLCSTLYLESRKT